MVNLKAPPGVLFLYLNRKLNLFAIILVKSADLEVSGKIFLIIDEKTVILYSW